MDCPTGAPTITFTSFNLENNWDFVHVDLTGNGAADLSFTGDSIPDPITGSAGTAALLVLMTDGSVGEPGFEATFTCEDIQPCDGDGDVTLIDGGDIAQGQYNNNQDSTWLLTCSDPSLAPQVTFQGFHTEGNWDFVYIYDGCNVMSDVAATLHGNLGDSVEPITGSSPSVLVRLVTDGSVTRGGFTASYTCGDAAPAAPPDPCGADPLLLTDGGEFFHSTLSANQQCRWVLGCSDSTLTPQITWTAFDLENAYDFVYLYEGGTWAPIAGSTFVGNPMEWLTADASYRNAPSTATTTLTGTETPDVWTDNSPPSMAAMLYVSDGSVDGQGFSGSFECIETNAAGR